MAINFPDNPTHGQSATLAGKSFTYDSDVSGWNVSSSASLDLSSIAQDILPDADSSRSLGSVSKKWKDLYLSGSTIYLGGLQLQNKLGQLSVADSTGKDISGFNTAPRFITSPPSVFKLDPASDSGRITSIAIDADGFPITYDWDGYKDSGGSTTLYNSTSLPPQVLSVTQPSNGVFKLTYDSSGGTTPAGEFGFRVKASDGALVSTATSTVQLTYSIPVVVDALQTRNSNTLQPTTDGTITTFHTNATSGGTGTLYFPTGAGNTMPTGKKYIEVKLTNASGDAWTVGIARTNDAAAHNANIGYNSTNSNQYNSQTQVSFNYATQHPNGAPNGTSTGFSSSPMIIANNSNDVFQIAYDTDAEKVWFGVNNTWASNTGDPITGAGRTIDYSQGGYSFIIGSETNGSISATFIFGGQVYAPPSGFTYY